MPQNGKLILDMSCSARALGPPTGIVRREQALVRHVLAERPDIQFAILDHVTRCYRAVEPAWAERLASGDHAVDTSAAGAQFSYGTVERDDALGTAVSPGSQDTVLSVGGCVMDVDFDVIAAQQQRFGFRYTAMCHDLIPLMFPQYCPENAARGFRRHWTAILPSATRILVNSRAVERDIRAFCRVIGRDPGEIVMVRPGCNLSGVEAAPELPAGLVKGRFALLVTTIEPRKGHDMILDVWRRLLEKGVPQHRAFKLVLVGRQGWKVDDLMRRLDDPAFAGTLLHLPASDDAMLAALYRDAAFCLLPSLYEGFGMPVIEAFAQGKAIIASNAGALPEVVAGLSPCLPPADGEAWLALLEKWIVDERAYAPYEAAIRASFKPVPWGQAAAEIFAAAVAQT